MPATTTINAIGTFFRKTFPSTSSTSAVPPIVSAARLVSSRWPKKVPLFCQKVPWPAWNPNNFGNWVLMRYTATPHLNPIMTLSEMKLMIEPALISQARRAISPTRMAVPAASAVNRVGSPPEMLPSVEPINSEMAEVTVMVVCRELQNSQKTSPPNMHA